MWYRRITLTKEGGPQQSLAPEGDAAVAKEIKFNLISLQRSVIGGESNVKYVRLSMAISHDRQSHLTL